MDEDMGKFLRCQAAWLAKLVEVMDTGRPLERGNTADALIRLAAELLAKAHEVDGRGFGPSVTPSVTASVRARAAHRHPH